MATKGVIITVFWQDVITVKSTLSSLKTQTRHYYCVGGKTVCIITIGGTRGIVETALVASLKTGIDQDLFYYGT